MTRLIDELDQLHDRYAHAVNVAIAADDLDQAHQLAAAYDDEAILLIAEREGLTHLLPLSRPARADSGLRARIRRLVAHRAA